MDVVAHVVSVACQASTSPMAKDAQPHVKDETEPKISTGACGTAVYMMTRIRQTPVKTGGEGQSERDGPEDVNLVAEYMM